MQTRLQENRTGPGAFRRTGSFPQLKKRDRPDRLACVSSQPFVFAARVRRRSQGPAGTVATRRYSDDDEYLHACGSRRFERSKQKFISERQTNVEHVEARVSVDSSLGRPFVSGTVHHKLSVRFLAESHFGDFVVNLVAPSPAAWIAATHYGFLNWVRIGIFRRVWPQAAVLITPSPVSRYSINAASNCGNAFSNESVQLLHRRDTLTRLAGQHDTHEATKS